MSYRQLRAALGALAITAAAALGACGETNLVRDAFVATGVGAKPPPAPDFVRDSRPATIDYLPVGVSAPARPVTRKTAAEVKASEAELDALRTAQEAQAAQARELAGAPAPAAVPPR